MSPPVLRPSSIWFWAPVCGLCVLLLVACAPPGQRLLRFEIELDGEVMFTGIRGVPDQMPVDEMWHVLSEVSFEAAPANTVQATASESLSGEIVVRIQHTGETLASATLEALALTRDSANATWHLSETEASRVESASAP